MCSKIQSVLNHVSIFNEKSVLSLMKKCKNTLYLLPCLIGVMWSEAVADPMEMDERDRQVLAKLSPADLAVFNKKLHEAMALYYDNAYHLSLPLFRDIAHRADTLDILYWYASAAQRSGQPDLAISKYLAVLERHPELNQVRLDLALAYVQKGDKESAEAEIQKVRENNPSLADQEKVAQLTANIGRMGKRLFSTFRASVGMQSDNNLNAQPDSDNKREGTGFPLSASLDTMYDFGKKQGAAVWHNNVSVYRIANRDASEFDYSQVDFRSGLEHYGEQWRLKLPVGFIDRQFGHKSLSESWYLAPEVNYALRKDLNLNLAYRVEREKSDVNTEQDNTTHSVALGPNWLFNDQANKRTSMVSLQADYANRDADRSDFSYNDLGLGSTWFMSLDSGIETFMQARYLDRRYQGAGPLAALFPSEREDQRFTATAMASRRFMDYYSASVNYTYTHNESNNLLFEYDKGVVGLNIGVVLSF